MSTLDTVPNTENDGPSRPTTIRLNPDVLAKVERFAKEDRRTRASFMLVMMLDGLAAYEKKHESTIA